jgi:hypothetical protein
MRPTKKIGLTIIERFAKLRINPRFLLDGDLPISLADISKKDVIKEMKEAFKDAKATVKENIYSAIKQKQIQKLITGTAQYYSLTEERDTTIIKDEGQANIADFVF